MVATMYLDAPNPPTPPLAEHDVRFVGQSIALVLADTPDAAIDAAALALAEPSYEAVARTHWSASRSRFR
jgi:CO/xanthine dehydrogenase Mo-binding subunit